MSVLDLGPYAVPVLAVSAVWLWPRPLRVPRPTPGLLAAESFPELSAVVTVVLAGWFLGSPVFVALGLIGAAACRLATRRRRRRNADSELNEALIGLVDDLAQQLRSGGVLASSFSALVADDDRLATSFGDVAAALSVGARLEPELRRLIGYDRGASERLVSIALSVLARSGGPSVPALERLAQGLRDRRASGDERRLQSSQARASASVLGILPIVFAAVAAWVEPALRHFYLYSLPGALCLLTMAGLLIAGWLWIDLLTEER